jgi:hypothetical protein
MWQAIVPESWAEAMDAEGFEVFKQSGVLIIPNLPPNRTARPSRGDVGASAICCLALPGRQPNADAGRANRGLK